MAGTVTQVCSTEGCGKLAAFRTTTRPSWCLDCIDQLFRVGGLIPLEPFVDRKSYRRTECIACKSHLPYRFEYVLDQRPYGPVCRVCHWREWGEQNRARTKTELDQAVGAALQAPTGLSEADRELLATDAAVRASVRRWWWPKQRIQATVGMLHHDLLFDTAEHNDGMDPIAIKCLNCGYEHVELPGRLAAELSGHWCLCPICNNRNKGICASDVVVGFSSHGMSVAEPEAGTDTVQAARCARCETPRRISMRRLNRGAVPCYVCDGAADPSSPHRVYLFHFPDWHAYKVGITNSGNDSRLDRHRLAGGQLIELIEVPHRGAAFWVEQEVLNAMVPWPATGLPTDRAISGWTEMWDDSAPINVRLGDYIEAANAITLDRELIEDWKRNSSVRVLPSFDFILNRGDTVCFTGSGPEKSRGQWKTLAQGVGLRVAGSVTSITSALVAPPGGSPNAKVVAALSTGVPVISYEDFLAAVEGLK